MAEGDLEIGEGVVVPAEEIRESASRSRGPGGQHVNKASTRVTLRWKAAETRALDATRRRRLLRRLGPRLTRSGDLVVHADTTRSRVRNREAARARMADLIAEALSVSRPRIATGPSRGARQRRVREKRHRSDVKQTRRPVRGEHDT